MKRSSGVDPSLTRVHRAAALPDVSIGIRPTTRDPRIVRETPKDPPDDSVMTMTIDRTHPSYDSKVLCRFLGAGSGRPCSVPACFTRSYRLHPASQASRGGAAAENLV